MKTIIKGLEPVIYAIIIFTMAMLGLLYVAPPNVEAANPQAFTFGGTAISSTTNYGGIKWAEGNPPHLSGDIFMEVDQGATTNTLTLTLQVSPDNSNWYDHAHTPSVLPSSAVDVSSYVTASIQGLYFRVQATVANTNNVTPTLRVVLR